MVIKHLTRKQRIIFINLVFVILLAAGLVYYNFLRKPHASEIANQIVNQATVSYCTQGDDATKCDPANNKYSGSALSNTVTTVISSLGGTPTPTPTPPVTTQVLLCLKVTSNYANATYPNLTLQIQKADNTALATVNNVPVTAGAPHVTDAIFLAALHASNAANLVAKADGYLGASVPVSQVAKTTCPTPYALTLNPGDFDNSGKVDLTNIARGIVMYEQKTKTAAYPNGMSLSDIAALIRLHVDGTTGATLAK